MVDLTQIPINPGCYLFKDGKGKILYVGKAKNLKKRVSSYFNKKNHDPKTEILVSLIKDVSFIVTNNEVEALILENNLIKKNQPKYNIDLKDARRYAYLKITDEKFPRVVLLRKRTSKDKGEYFGPFVSGSAREEIKSYVQKTFQIRTCNKLPKRECLRYHIDLCSGPCIGKISEKDYKRDVNSAREILSGNIKPVIKKLKSEMTNSSQKNNFEKALTLRDRISSLNYLSEKQMVQREKKYDEDIINYVFKDGKIMLIVFNIHKGMLLNKQEFCFDYYENSFSQFLIRFYDHNRVPKELILPHKIDQSIEKYLQIKLNKSDKSNKKNSFLRKKKFKVIVPKIGEKKKLLDLVLKNIELSFFSNLSALNVLREKLRLENLPNVIECFDISHLGGTMIVASMTQFRYGKPDKSNYRRFRIKTVKGNDDFASIAEVVRRRYSRLLKDNAPMPDLIVIDGGKGQLSFAVNELKDLGLKLPIIGLAKKFEEIYLPGMSMPLRLSHKNKGLQLLQRVRDEAHRFAISYNKLLRKKKVIM
jgi:excinuclease ABC subunit C